jgi:hypothetical protein
MDTNVNIEVRTEKGVITNPTTLNSCLDLFFSIGAMRGRDVTSLYSKAYSENPIVATKILFWSRDIRGGAGERKIFRDILNWLLLNDPQTIKRNVHLISEYGRWDDVLGLINTELEKDVFNLIKTALNDGNGLCAKWMPRKGKIANKLRKLFKLTPKQYRKMVVNLTNVVETNMCSKEWYKIDYSKIPSMSASRYQNAFIKNDSERYLDYKEKLISGETKVNASTLYPYDIIKSLENNGDVVVSEKQWESLPNYMEDSDERILPVVDVSGSMTNPVGDNPNLTCMDVSISLGLYISERNSGDFKDAFITFSERPTLQYLTGTLSERYENLRSADWGYSTNINSVFQLILNQAVSHNVPEEKMPTIILILSDMEFDMGVRDYDTDTQTMIETRYKEFGYKVPKIVYWNLNSRTNENFPVLSDKKNVALVSGFSPSVVKSILNGNDFSPIGIMLDTINSERYELIE